MSTRKAAQFRRDRQRISDYNARKSGFEDADDQESKDWSRAGTRFENPPARDANGDGIRKPKGKGRRKQGRSPPRSREEDAKTPAAQKSYAAQKASPPSDELRYSIPTLANMTPARNYGLINTTAEGYLNVIEQCHYKMSQIDNRVTRVLPLAVFTHNCTQLYHLHMLKIARETGQSVTWTDQDGDIDVEDLERLLNANTALLPAEIYDWLKGLGRFKDKTGYDYVPNVPYSIVPKKRKTGSTGGDFGKPTHLNHNAYEISISPCVTRATVQALLNNITVNGNIDYAPLPAGLTPENGTPTGNLLGYRRYLRPWHRETLESYAQALESWSATPLGSRIGYNPVLWSKQNAVLNGFKEKMEFKIGMPPTDKGSLSLYGTIVYDYEEPEAILRRTSGYLESAADLDPGSLSAAAIKTYRRERTQYAPGYCYVGADAQPLRHWDTTINSSYLMEAPFRPTYGEVDLTLNEPRFRRDITEGRFEMILEEITRMTVKK